MAIKLSTSNGCPAVASGFRYDAGKSEENAPPTGPRDRGLRNRPAHQNPWRSGRRRAQACNSAGVPSSLMASKTALTSGEGAMQRVLYASTTGTLKQLSVRGVRGVRRDSVGGLRISVRRRGIGAS